ncbi:single-stranded-DNA-specific exonuclease RecJ [Candidatus Margulisiibacteriota bacterium]
MKKTWQTSKPEDAPVAALARELNISSLTARVLVNRGIKSPAEADVFLNPRLAHLRDPMEIPDIERAARRVLLAKEAGEKVLVFGDYDVDGVTGTAILLETLKFLGIQASYYIPHRYGEGYSLSLEAVRDLAKQGVKLIITVDCGVSNLQEIAEANSLGLEVIVTDHHNLPKVLPPAAVVVNPKMISGQHPARDLSGAGVAFKFAWALLRVAQKKDGVFLSSLLDLAALGTISDMVPLVSENRILAVTGLRLIDQRKRLGIKHLAEVASLHGRILVNHIYFGLAPRINAAGRLEHASKSLELLLADDAARAQTLAAELDRINLERRDIGSNIKEEVFAQLTEDYIEQNKLVVLSGVDWHPGVIGIVASQVVDRYTRPAVLVGVNDGVGRGSARSLPGVNMYELLDSCRDLFLDFGGHEAAAGFEIKSEKIPELVSRLRQQVDQRLTFDDLRPVVLIDAELDPALISLGLVRELAALDPHGEGNPQPVFMSRALKLADVRRVGSNGRHLKLRLQRKDSTLDAIGFALGDLADKLSYNNVYDIAYKLESNEWNGFESAQLSLVDIREAEA